MMDIPDDNYIQVFLGGSKSVGGRKGGSIEFFTDSVHVGWDEDGSDLFTISLGNGDLLKFKKIFISMTIGDRKSQEEFCAKFYNDRGFLIGKISLQDERFVDYFKRALEQGIARRNFPRLFAEKWISKLNFLGKILERRKKKQKTDNTRPFFVPNITPSRRKALPEVSARRKGKE